MTNSISRRTILRTGAGVALASALPLRGFAQEPAKPAEPEKKKGFVCTVCGYVHDSDTLPADFICPICHNPAEFFKPIE